MDDLEDLSRRVARPQNGLDPTRARPQPWFVGGGARLATAIITLVGVLIVLRLVTSAWMVEDAWRWWSTRVKASAPPVAIPPPVIIPAPAARAPLPGSGAASATPARALGEEARWITSDDYPPASLRKEEEGRSTIHWRIDADGRVRVCRTIASSGYPRLDAAACRAIVRSARYEPARDASGRAIASYTRRNVRWTIPE